MPKKKNISKKDILLWIKHQVDNNMHRQLTNWHLNDDLYEFMTENCTIETTLKQASDMMTRYCRVLVDYGYLLPPSKTGIDFGGLYEFGSRTQTIWTKNINFLIDIVPNKRQRESGMRCSQLEHKFYKKHNNFFDKEIIELLKGEYDE